MTASALTIAGSDSGGGAGIQADLKTFSALGVYATTAITAITAQNTRAVSAIGAIAPDLVAAQIDAVLSDIEIHAIKIGMLASAEVIAAVAGRVRAHHAPLVLDPVMVAKSGDALLRDDAVAALGQLVPRADLITPNLPEVARLLGTDLARDTPEMAAQARGLLAQGARAVLLKGGHGSGPLCTDLLVTGTGAVRALTAARIATSNTHGTGCTLSAAIAAWLARGADLETAVLRAHNWLQGALRAADGLGIGGGHGPVHHFHALWGEDGLHAAGHEHA